MSSDSTHSRPTIDQARDQEIMDRMPEEPVATGNRRRDWSRRTMLGAMGVAAAATDAPAQAKVTSPTIPLLRRAPG